MLFTSIATSFIYSDDSIHSATFRYKMMKVKKLSTFCFLGYPIYNLFLFISPPSLLSFPPSLLEWGLLVLLAEPKVGLLFSLEVFAYMNYALWKVCNLYTNIKIGKIWFMYICNFQTLIYKELRTAKSVTPVR